jgi:hypothetical protein
MRTSFWTVALISVTVVTTAAAQDPPARGRQGQGGQGQGGFLGRPSPPQPQQHQGLDYFAGTWKFTWIGRESAITPGPRSGTLTFTRTSDPTALDMRVEGSSEASGAYKESGTVTWNEATKTLAMREHLAGGADLVSNGDWSSPIGIHFEGDPIALQGQTLRLRRHYQILSPTSFSVTEELSTNGGPFVRLGTGDFRK